MLIERLYPSSLIKLDQDSIHNITEACDVLRDGSMTVDSLWPGKKHDMHVLLSEKYTTYQAAHGLLTLRRTLRALERLQLSLRAKIHFTEKNVWPAVLHHGLETLPDDILLKILRLCYYTPGVESDEREKRENAIVESHKSVRRLALVSRQFNNVVHHLPSLRSDETGLNYSERTGYKEPSILGTPVVAGLHVILSSHSSRSRFDSLLRHANKICSIDSFTLWSSPSPYGKGKAAITMPLLKGLMTDYLSSYDIQHLHLPALQHLKIRDMRDDLPRMLMPQLTTLSFKTEYMETPEEVETLIDTLSTASKLQHLQLGLRFSGDLFLDAEWNRKISQLPDLVSISLSIGFDCEKDTDWNVSMFKAAATIITSIDAPQLLHVGLKIYAIDDDEFPAACPWHEMFPPHRDYSNLQSVQLWVYDTGGEGDFVANLYPGLLRALPHVKSLVLRPTYLEEDNEGIPGLAKLRELTLDECDMDEHALECILSRIFAQEEVNLERIVINNHYTHCDYRHHSCIPTGWNFLHEKLAKADENVYLDFS